MQKKPHYSLHVIRCTFIIIANRCKQSWLTLYADAFAWNFISQMNTSIEQERAYCHVSIYVYDFINRVCLKKKRFYTKIK